MRDIAYHRTSHSSGPAGRRHTADVLTIRPAGLDDSPALFSLAQQAYGRYVGRIGRNPAPMDADYEAAVSTGLVWVAEQGQRIVGLLVLEIRDDHVLIENVAVSPNAQGGGVGSRLLTLADDQARERGLREVRLYTHEAMTENQQYYRRRGYQETHRSGDSGFERVFFTKSL